MASDPLSIWTVYDKRLEPPASFVALRWLVGREQVATPDILVAATLQEIRSLLPLGLFCLTRDVNDEPTVVESWL